VKVLIVDDEKPARDRLRQILQDEDDFEVVAEAGNGHDALSIAAECEPDIVLLDIRMPGLDGIETAHHLNTLERTPAVVFTTAYDEYAVDAFEARAIGYRSSRTVQSRRSHPGPTWRGNANMCVPRYVANSN
jgi:two-component system response regulator AlgR